MTGNSTLSQTIDSFKMPLQGVFTKIPQQSILNFNARLADIIFTDNIFVSTAHPLHLSPVVIRSEEI